MFHCRNINRLGYKVLPHPHWKNCIVMHYFAFLKSEKILHSKMCLSRSSGKRLWMCGYICSSQLPLFGFGLLVLVITEDYGQLG